MSIGQYSDSASLPPSKEHVDPGDTDPDAEFGGLAARKQLERKLVRKLDLRMSILVLIYILNYVDRNNAGKSAARSRGLVADLHLTDQQFATLLSILYVGYIIMQIPSNMFLNFTGKPSLYLSACMAVWGVMSALTGITTNFTGAVLTRFFLGFVEAAFFPGALFLISKWFRTEIGFRTAILYCGNIVSNAFGALLASGILGGMNNVLGHAAWRWLFYLEGSLTVFVAICAIFILPDFPSTTKWLSDDERRLALRRMEEDAGVGDQKETEQGGLTYGLYLAVTDWTVWWFVMAMNAIVISLSFNAYFPTLSATLGYNPTVSLLLVAPPFVFAVIVAFCLSRHSDCKQERFYHIIGSWIVGIIGFIIAISTMNTAARYVSLFLMAQTRAVCVAIINGFSQLGNVAGSYIWPSSWGPTYRFSYGICIASGGTAIIMVWVFKQHLISLNKKLEREEQEKGIKEKGFRYLL
ncbi:sugar transporter [Suillus subaureus]|uniref:Sugar transporter n=1 Tax=Suillus subaureus TaxID=48587 RepID=A0A9P7EFW0_9AGAM|nr:sugar transporter [Suillus subaureus]KAG1820238.1 sugar transporter [Suillus subaureus]